MASINTQPAALDLALYAGDGVEFRLICKDSNDAPVPIDGEVTAQVRVDRTPESTALADFNCNIIDGSQGIIELSLTGDQTQELVADPSSRNGKFTGVWDVQWAATGKEPRTLCQGKVECVADVTR